MRFDVITLFPALFEPHRHEGVTRRAFGEGGPVELKLWPLREHATDRWRRVDDRPFGGGPGMVMMAEPLERAWQAVCADRRAAGLRTEAPEVPVLLFSPSGRRLDQALVRELAVGPGAVLVCGRYEGIDQRFVDRRVTMEVSLGDFVLSGGELPALVLLDAVARLLPGVIEAASHQDESFEQGLLDHAHYTRPPQWPPAQAGADEAADAAATVPPVLLGGDHAAIARWRRDDALRRTAARRPELLEQARREGRLDKADERALAPPAAGESG